ncbi:hypothetical protein [Rhizobium brockwellii]|uniref:hypothetical protein n=1 Tax=Rhizobium brockwellii TaxID=3019932 RepID=UPI003F9BEE8F
MALGAHQDTGFDDRLSGDNCRYRPAGDLDPLVEGDLGPLVEGDLDPLVGE